MAATVPKRPLFSKPAWMTTTSSDEPVTEDRGIFGRSAIYEDILAADRQKETERKQSQKRKVRNIPEVDKGLEREIKRRRVSVEEDEKHEGIRSDSEADSQDKTSDIASCNSSEERSEMPITRSTPKTKNPLEVGLGAPNSKSQSPTKSRTSKVKVISLDDDDDDDVKYVGKSKTNNGEIAEVSLQESQTFSNNRGGVVRKKDSESEEEEDEEDEYLRELKRKARQKWRVGRTDKETDEKPADIHVANLIPHSSDQRPLSRSIPRDDLDSRMPNDPSQKMTPLPATNDPIVHIRIISIIPNTKELVVKRLASQPLQFVREYWCNEQGFDERITSRVFLTWRGTRLFNSTTARSIIQRLTKESGNADGFDPSFGRIEVEAMTQEIFDLRKKQRERRIMEEAGLKLDVVDNDNKHTDSEDEANAKSLLPTANSDTGTNTGDGMRTNEDSVIRLVCQGIEPVVMRVRPNSKISKIMYAFQKTRQIDAEKTCWLVFDGERLDPDTTVKDVGLENEDNVEVYLR